MVTTLLVDTDMIVHDVENFLGEMSRTQKVYNDEIEEINEDDHLDLQSKKKKYLKANAQFRRRIAEDRDAALTILVAALEKLDHQEAVLHRRTWNEPKDLTEWQMASARAQFVEEDCQAWAKSNPKRIVDVYRFALADGDRVPAFLLERYGPQALETEGARRELDLLLDIINEAASLYDAKLGKITEFRSRINKLQNELFTICPPDACVFLNGSSTSSEKDNGKGDQVIKLNTKIMSNDVHQEKEDLKSVRPTLALELAND